MSKFSDKDTSFKTSHGYFNGGPSVKADRYGNYDGGRHEHTWSKTGGDRHQEGWVGKDFSRSRDASGKGSAGKGK